MSNVKKVTESSFEFRVPMKVSMGQQGESEEQVELNMKARWYDDVHEQMEELVDKWLEEHPEYEGVRLFHYDTKVVFDLGVNTLELADVQAQRERDKSYAELENALDLCVAVDVIDDK